MGEMRSFFLLNYHFSFDVFDDSFTVFGLAFFNDPFLQPVHPLNMLTCFLIRIPSDMYYIINLIEGYGNLFTFCG